MNGAELSIKSMFLHADPVVQGVMIILFLASLASWVIIFEKTVLLWRTGLDIRLFLEMTNKPNLNIEACPGLTRPIAETGLAESREFSSGESRADFRARLESVMRIALAGHLNRLEHRTLFLATVAASSPFIGLFGTVWGIMHSFIGIAASGETTLAVVAPGIAEALLATAMGLMAAIPAVIAFNKISNAHKRMGRQALAAISLLGNQLARRYYRQNTNQTKPEAA
jgi:biopolymer transport protein ExbB/TolQ